MARGFAMLTGRPQTVKLHPIVDPHNPALSLCGAYLQGTPLVVISSYVRRLGHPSGERHPPRDNRAVRRLIHPRRDPATGAGGKEAADAFERCLEASYRGGAVGVGANHS